MDRILGRAAVCAVLKRVSRGMYRAKLVPEGLQSLAVAISGNPKPLARPVFHPALALD